MDSCVERPNLIRVTCEDLTTGEIKSAEIWDSYMVICAGNRYLAATQIHGNGTAVITIKTDKRQSRG
jgi:hypothetical protein